MKTVVLLLLGLTIALALPLEEKRTGGWYTPKFDGSLEWTSEEELEAVKEAYANERAVGAVKFYLYTTETTSAEIILGNDISLTNSGFNGAIPTRIIIHGWTNNKDSEVNTVLRSAFLATGTYNVISVDWSSMSSQLYNVAIASVPDTGVIVANFIDFLYTSGDMSFETLLVAGHSLGAHVAGFAGRNVQDGTIFQIIGLDPAGPGYSYSNPEGRLNTGDAFYVESIQTSNLGFSEPIGEAAFYPNGGSSQPGCGIFDVGICAHGRSFIYLAQALRWNNFLTMQCSTYELARAKNCGIAYSTVKMGDPDNYMNAVGAFYVPLNNASPYGKGTVPVNELS